MMMMMMMMIMIIICKSIFTALILQKIRSILDCAVNGHAYIFFLSSEPTAVFSPVFLSQLQRASEE